MAKDRFDVRIAIGSAAGPRTSVWAVWANKSEIYAAHRTMGGIHKFSFHTPTLCLHAFTKEYSEQKSVSKRSMHRWHRGVTPPAGANQVVRVLRISASTDHLSTAFIESVPNDISWINPAPSGGSTFIDICFTNESEATLRTLLAGEPANLQHKLQFFRQLPNGEAFAISTFHSDQAEKVFRVSAAPHDPYDLIILPIDPENSGRPVRLSLFSNPKDGDFLVVWEMGGYWHEPLTDVEWSAMSAPFVG